MHWRYRIVSCVVCETIDPEITDFGEVAKTPMISKPSEFVGMFDGMRGPKIFFMYLFQQLNPLVDN